MEAKKQVNKPAAVVETNSDDESIEEDVDVIASDTDEDEADATKNVEEEDEDEEAEETEEETEEEEEAGEEEAGEEEAGGEEAGGEEAGGEEAGEEEAGEEEAETIKKSKKQKKTIVSNIGIEMLKTTAKKTQQKINYDDDDDDDDDEDEDINYLQKFDSKMRDNFIIDHHPESRTHNYEEVKAMTRVSRDGRGIIIDPLHKTIPFLTKYEMTRVIGQRAKQLDHGAKAFVKVPLNVIDGYHIALLELEQKKIPFIIKRPYPNGGVEYWNVSDLEVLL